MINNLTKKQLILIQIYIWMKAIKKIILITKRNMKLLKKFNLKLLKMPQNYPLIILISNILAWEINIINKFMKNKIKNSVKKTWI